jgi:ABC-type multidrug transport system fused ATPase/permease subunit
MMGNAFSFTGDFNKALAAGARVFQLLDRKPKIESTAAVGLKLDQIDGSLCLRDAEFAYPTRRDVAILRQLQLAVRSGQQVALVGESGCGKSTVLQLIQRLYDLDQGRLELQGRDIQTLNLPYVRSKLGIVSQEPVLFDRSIAENIQYGDNSRTVSMEEVIAAARQANIHETVAALPQGYDTRVGSRGTQLSGGQKQRVAIARVLVRNPRILLLDEATSALDTESEAVVQEALETAQAGRTSVTIAHRLSTIKGSDQIFVMERGEIVECGTHCQLLEMRGAYCTFWNSSTA